VDFMSANEAVQGVAVGLAVDEEDDEEEGVGVGDSLTDSSNPVPPRIQNAHPSVCLIEYQRRKIYIYAEMCFYPLVSLPLHPSPSSSSCSSVESIESFYSSVIGGPL
jgi:hypothetical protein